MARNLFHRMSRPIKAEPAGDDNPEVALILGAAVWEHGPSPALRRRAERALELWRSGTARLFVASGGLGRWPPTEARAIATILEAGGVPSDRIHLEDRSTSTWENLSLSLPILRRLGATRIWIVTDAYHMPRARLIARGLGLRTKAAPVPGNRPGRRRRLGWALREAPAILHHVGRRAMGRRGPGGRG